MSSRMSSLIMKDENIARFWGHFHPDVLGLFDYILDELNDTAFESAIRGTKIEITYNTISNQKASDRYILRANVRAFSRAIRYDNDYSSGAHITLWLCDGSEFNIELSGGSIIFSERVIVLSRLFLYSQLYLMAYSTDSIDITEYQRVYTKGFDIFLERFDYDLQHGLDRKPLEAYILANKDNVGEILDCCNKHEWNELTMEILRITKEAGLHSREETGKFRL